MIVTTVLDTPYTMLRDTPLSNLTGNDRYEGYAVDLVDAISKILSKQWPFICCIVFLFMNCLSIDFNYVLKINDAGTYGSIDKAGKWNGMIREVLDGRTHIAAGAITITAERYTYTWIFVLLYFVDW